jgi:hypothetical protein
MIARDPEALLKRFESWQPPNVRKWITKEET